MAQLSLSLSSMRHSKSRVAIVLELLRLRHRLQAVLHKLGLPRQPLTNGLRAGRQVARLDGRPRSQAVQSQATRRGSSPLAQLSQPRPRCSALRQPTDATVALA